MIPYWLDIGCRLLLGQGVTLSEAAVFPEQFCRKTFLNPMASSIPHDQGERVLVLNWGTGADQRLHYTFKHI